VTAGHVRASTVCGGLDINLVVTTRSRAMNIGELALATETKAEAIRYYERIGLLPAPPRTGKLPRLFSGACEPPYLRPARPRPWLLQIRALLDLADQKEQSCEAVDAIAREHLAYVKRKLADHSALRRELDSLIERCRHGTVAECRILEALAPDATNMQRT
jgi:DNA-binding transcriptional MerR regulator